MFQVVLLTYLLGALSNTSNLLTIKAPFKSFTFERGDYGWAKLIDGLVPFENNSLEVSLQNEIKLARLGITLINPISS